MHSIKDILGMIATEAAESLPIDSRLNDLPPIKYRYEFIIGDDGKVREYY